MVLEVEGSRLANFGEGTQITIDFQAAEEMAKKFDFQGRDLQLHVDYEFPNAKPVNFVVIDPVLFGTSAFAEVVDVATLSEEGEFETVDGFENQAFDKVLTPEANKVIDDDVISKTLAPSQFAYEGLGVFAFPLRITTKLRVTLLMRDPVPNIYERLHVLTQEVITDTIVSKKKKKGLF